MARAAVAIPSPVTRVNTTLVVWGLVTLIGPLLMPWWRVGRELAEFAPHSAGFDLIAGGAWSAGLVLVCAGMAALLGIAQLPLYRRGRLALGVGLVGGLAALWTIESFGRPMGPGALAAVLGCLTLIGIGLALGGYLRADAFIAVCIVWSAVFVAIFVIYPLWSVLKESVYADGHLTFRFVRETISSPSFLLIDNPTTPENEARPALVAGAVLTAAIAVVAGLRTRSLRRAAGWTIVGGVVAFILSALYVGIGAVRNSIILALTVSTISTALGFLFAILAERSRLPTRRLFGPVSILPIITPPFVLGLAIIYLFGRRGYVTHELLGLNTNIFFGLLGLSLAQVLAYTPIAFLILVGVVGALNVAMEEAAETLGANRWHILRTVIWPLARPGLANAFLLVAIESLADFGNPVIVGGGKPYLATEIYFAYLGGAGRNIAAVFGVTLLMMTLTIFLAQYLWLGQKSYVTVTGKPGQGISRVLPPTLDYAVTGIFIVWILLIVLLYGSVAVGSVTKLWGFDYTFTLAHIKGLSPTGWAVFRTSARLSILAAVPSTAVGLIIGYLVTRFTFPGRNALQFASMLSFAAPGTVMGIGYILAFNQGPLLFTGTGLIIILAFVFRNMPVALRAGVAAITQIDRSLEEASTMLRAGSATTFRRIVLPLIPGALLSGLIFSFVRAMTAISQVIFLITPGTNLATTQILTYVNYGAVSLAAALSMLLVIFMALVIVVLYLLMNRSGSRTAGQMPTF